MAACCCCRGENEQEGDAAIGWGGVAGIVRVGLSRQKLGEKIGMLGGIQHTASALSSGSSSKAIFMEHSVEFLLLRNRVASA